MLDFKISVLDNEHKQRDLVEFADNGLEHKDAVGLILETPIMKRVMAFDQWKAECGSYEKLALSDKKYTGEAEVFQELSGYENTMKIVEAQSGDDTQTAAKMCVGYNRGGLKWYLPCPQELAIIAAHREEINDALIQLCCSEDMMIDEESCAWSSSEHSQYTAWDVLFNGGYFGYGTKLNTYVVRAVAAFEPDCGSAPDEPPVTKNDEQLALNVLHCVSDTVIVDELIKRGYHGQITRTISL